jgi:glycosyltransferase involved in cell wall biosynthesis
LSHIALLIPGLDHIAGAERQVVLLALGLRKRGWRVSVIALSGNGGPAAAELTAAGISFLSLEMRKGLADPRGWIRLRRWLLREAPEVVHAHLPHAAWIARWSRLAAPVRVLIDTLHSTSTGTWGRRAGYRYSRWLPERVTAVGSAVADAYLGADMVSSRRLIIVPNGVDIETWHPNSEAGQVLRRAQSLEGGFLWLAAGRLDPVKDYPTLLQALARTPIEARLVIAGRGPLESDLRCMAQALGIGSRVRFLGFVPDVLPWMQAADGFVQSSLWEGLPVSLLEAGACALPTVATNVPGTREVIADRRTGWLAPPSNPGELAARMIAAMQSSTSERTAIGATARKQVVDHFSLGAVLDRWEALYAELLAQNPNPSRWSRSA